MEENGNMLSVMDKNYGPQCQRPDLTEHQIAQEREKHLEKLTENQKNRITIEMKTRD